MTDLKVSKQNSHETPNHADSYWNDWRPLAKCQH